MIALLLVVALFLFLTFVGQAVISLLRPRLGVLWSWFIAPMTGLALLLAIGTRLSVWGLPFKVVGPWLTLGLAVFTGVVFWWRRPVLPWRHLAPFFAITLGYLLYTGWPLFLYGFNWISYGNDDMANYTLAADRFLNHGYYQLPRQTDLEGMDYTQHYWFMHGLQQIRAGSELTVAWAASLTGRNPHEVFMPVILMMSMMQIFTMGAAAVYRGRYRKIALVGFFLFATSPLFGLGTLYQLIAQVGGIAVLLAAITLLFSARFLSVRKLLLASLLTCCLGLVYPEVSPFIALGIVLFAIRLRYTNLPMFGRYVLFVAGVAVLTFLLLGTSTYEFINTLVMQSVGSAGLGAMAEINDQSGGLVLFPWTLVPSFIPMLFGLHPFGVVGFDPLISIQIAVGFVFLGYTIWAAGRNVVQDAPMGYLAAIMIPLGFYLFFKGQDFGLFKLAMFAQPVITLFLAQGFARFLFSPSPQFRRRARVVLVLFFLCTMPSDIYYSYASLGTYGGGLTEVVGASRLGVRFDPPKNLKYDAIESDISNVVSAKMLSQYTQGIDTRFLSRSYMDNIANIAVLKFLRTPDPDLGPQARIVEKLALLRFLLPSEIMIGDVPDYRVMTINKLDNNWTETSSRQIDYRDRLFVAIRTEFDHFNKANPGDGWTIQHVYQYKLESQLKDRLVFLHSELGPHYYSSARFKAAFFQREPEPVSARRVYFHGSGRYNLFHIINPSPDLRVVVDLTRTSLGEGRSKLPTHAVVIGEDDYRLPFVGHGSARVFSPVIKPEHYEKQAYITVDFGDRPAPILKRKTGLMRLYGVRYNLDDRRLIGFVRDISVMTDEQYRALPRPTKISEFPWDLYKYQGLEYSGMFEDGWVAEDAYFKFGSSHPGQVLYFKGFIPETAKFHTEGVDLTVSINEKPTEIVHLQAGEFTLARLIKEPANITSISLHFSDAQTYGKDDYRAVSAFVREISIGDIPDLAAFRNLTNQQGDKFALTGVDEDGWIGQTAVFNTPPFPEFKVLKVDLEMPGWAPVSANEIKVYLNGALVQIQTAERATYLSLYVPLPVGGRNEVRLEAGQAFPLPNDARNRAFLIKNISFENQSRTDLFVRGWHQSGYLFGIDHADNDGWVDRQIDFSFPATDRFKMAYVDIVRFPAHADLPLSIRLNGGGAETRTLELEKVERLAVPLSATRAATLSLLAPRSYPLAAPDTRERSFRIANIDFE
jgi:hypothetical protein